MYPNITPSGVVKFLKRSFSSLFLLCLLNSSVKAQYCTPTNSIQDETITRVILGSINNPSGYGTGGYSNFSAMSTTAAAGSAVTFNVTYAPTYTGDAVSIWVDYNNNGVFTDAGELVSTIASGPSGTAAGTFTIPPGTSGGTKRVRVRLLYNIAPDPCINTTFGETEDYSLAVTTTPCTGTPAPGATNSTATTVCSGTSFTLSPANSTAGAGVTYQYFQSATGVAGSYTPITGATSSSYTTAVSNMYYYVVVTCGGNSGTSAPVFVATTPANQCYCASSPSFTADEDVFNVTVGSLNNSSTCTTLAPGPGSVVNKYSNYTSGTGAPAAPNLIQGGNNPFSVGIGTCGTFAYTNSVAIFIDLNQDGDFIDAGEKVYVSPGGTPGAHIETGNLVIPASALLGATRMRVISNETGTPGSITPCGTYFYGETEDYNVNIVPCVPVSITTQPTNASAACGSNASFTVATSGSLPTYQWEYMAPNSTTWVLITNAAPFSGANTATLTVAATGSLNGYKFRAIVAGACTGPDFSNSATLTVTPIQLAIAPSIINKCLAGPAVLISAPSTQSVISGTNTTAVPVPDNTAAGATSSIAIAGIPGGASIQRIDVKFNMPHTYVGDMIFNLKAPGGQIINLDKYMGGTGNQAGPYPNTGFVNTIISSAGVTALSSVNTQPVTGTFKADAISGAVPGFPVANPTGYTPTTTSWTTLAPNGTAANGTWILAMADGGPADIGTLTNWTITITYGGAPATVTFTPTAGLFTDAAGTIPYTGGAVTQVYAAPTATSSIYKAVVTSGVCSTDSQTIVVNVNTPAGGTPTLSNTSVCVGSNTFLKLGGTLTGGPGFVHNFQVKAPGAATFTNITAGGVYSFNGDSLKLTGVPLSFNGYQFRDSVSTGGNCGSVISTVATLSVNPIPVVAISVAPRVNLFPGLTTTLTATVTGATPPVTYQWFRNGVAVAGATNSTLVVGIDGVGTYTVRATAQGCSSADSTTTPKTITIGDSVGVTTLFIYPSPNTGKFQVRYFSDINNGAKSPAMVNVFDQKGAKVFSKSYGLGAGYQQMNVDLGTHGKGIYRVELTDLNGDRIKTGSVMVF